MNNNGKAMVSVFKKPSYLECAVLKACSHGVQKIMLAIPHRTGRHPISLDTDPNATPSQWICADGVKESLSIDQEHTDHELIMREIHDGGLLVSEYSDQDGMSMYAGALAYWILSRNGSTGVVVVDSKETA